LRTALSTLGFRNLPRYPIIRSRVYPKEGTRAGRVVQVGECLPSKRETLSSKPGTTHTHTHKPSESEKKVLVPWSFRAKTHAWLLSIGKVLETKNLSPDFRVLSSKSCKVWEKP
jgi:hypothetical protein